MVSSFVHSPLPLLSSSHPSLSSSSCQKVVSRQRGLLAMASLRDESLVNGGNFPHRRRAFLLVGISVLPLLQLSAIALEGPVRGGRRGKRSREQTPVAVKDKEREEDESAGNPQANIEDIEKPEAQGPEQVEQEFSSQEPSQSEQVYRQNAPENPFVSLLNEIGIIGSGVLGALYANSLKEKTTMETTIESMKAKLTEKEAAAILLRENFETRLLNEQEERRKQIIKLKEEESTLSNKLISANGTITALNQELHRGGKIIEELQGKVSELKNGVIQAGEDKTMLEAKVKENNDAVDVLQDKVSLLSLEISDKDKNIGKLSLSLAEKESECKNLSFIIDQTKTNLAEANSTVKKLKEEAFKASEEIISKETSIDGLNARIESLHSGKNDTEKRLHDLIKDYTDLKSSSERERVRDSELLSEKDSQLHRLEEKLEQALHQANATESVIANLTKERDVLKALLEEEVNGMKKLKGELQNTQETLGASRLEASNLSEELEEMKRLYEGLTFKFSKMQDEFNEAKSSLISNLDKEKSTSEALFDEVALIMEVLKKTKEELGVASNELDAVIEDRENFKKELLELQKKVETTEHELKEERKAISTLNRELEVLGKQILNDLEARRALEGDLDDATKSLDEMNKSALFLSKELEDNNSRIATLEAEKGMLFKSLIEHKNIAKEGQENVEDAQNLIMRLGSERESLEKMSKHLEEGLAAAKGEILRLRRQISMMGKESVNDHRNAANEVGDGSTFGVKRVVSKRKKGGSTSENS